MLKRQDRQGVRSPADIERKYNQFANKVETDSKGKLKSRVHVTGSEFTVDTKNFKLDEKGNVSITGELETISSNRKTLVKGGEIYVEAPYDDNVEPGAKFDLLYFKGPGNQKYALCMFGTIDKNTLTFDFSHFGVEHRGEVE